VDPSQWPRLLQVLSIRTSDNRHTTLGGHAAWSALHLIRHLARVQHVIPHVRDRHSRSHVLREAEHPPYETVGAVQVEYKHYLSVELCLMIPPTRLYTLFDCLFPHSDSNAQSSFPYRAQQRNAFHLKGEGVWDSVGQCETPPLPLVRGKGCDVVLFTCPFFCFFCFFFFFL
jgi:hypothetical protein